MAVGGVGVLVHVGVVGEFEFGFSVGVDRPEVVEVGQVGVFGFYGLLLECMTLEVL